MARRGYTSVHKRKKIGLSITKEGRKEKESKKRKEKKEEEEEEREEKLERQIEERSMKFIEKLKKDGLI